MDLMDSEHIIIKLVALVLNIISLLSIFVIFYLHIYKPQLRSPAFTLVLFLQLSDAFLSFSLVLIIFDPIDPYHTAICKFQAFFLVWGGTSSVIWTLVIARCIHLSIKKQEYDIHKNILKLVTIAFFLPGLVCIIPYLFNDYGNSNNFWCWIKKDEQDERSIRRKLFTIFPFYLFAWISIVYNIYISFKVRKYINIEEPLLKDEAKSQIKKFTYIPLILIIGWTFASINRIYGLFGKHNFYLTLFHIIFQSLTGFMNTIFYVLNPEVKKELKSTFISIVSRKETSGDEIIIPKIIN